MSSGVERLDRALERQTDETVYVSQRDSTCVYHAEDCGSLGDRPQSLARSDAEAAGLRACQHCLGAVDRGDGPIPDGGIRIPRTVAVTADDRAEYHSPWCDYTGNEPDLQDRIRLEVAGYEPASCCLETIEREGEAVDPDAVELAVRLLAERGETDPAAGGVPSRRVAEVIHATQNTVSDKLASLVEQGRVEKVVGLGPHGQRPSYLPAVETDDDPHDGSRRIAL